MGIKYYGTRTVQCFGWRGWKLGRSGHKVSVAHFMSMIKKSLVHQKIYTSVITRDLPISWLSRSEISTFQIHLRAITVALRYVLFLQNGKKLQLQHKVAFMNYEARKLQKNRSRCRLKSGSSRSFLLFEFPMYMLHLIFCVKKKLVLKNIKIDLYSNT